MVSESTLNIFSSFSYFSYIDIESIIISNKISGVTKGGHGQAEPLHRNFESAHPRKLF
jgi:hypothetical protein